MKRNSKRKISAAVSGTVENTIEAGEVQTEAANVVALVQVAVPIAAVPTIPAPAPQKATEIMRARTMNFIYIY